MQASIDSCKMVIEQQSLKISELETKLNYIYSILVSVRNSLNENSGIGSTLPSTSNVSDVTKQDDQRLDAPGQCKAITATGNRCSRNAQPGSDYCWQHAAKSSDNVNTTNNSSYSGSREIHTGSRGGQYYINSHGNKTYVRRK